MLLLLVLRILDRILLILHLGALPMLLKCCLWFCLLDRDLIFRSDLIGYAMLCRFVCVEWCCVVLCV